MTTPLATVYPNGRVRLTKQAAILFGVKEGSRIELEPADEQGLWYLDCRPTATARLSNRASTWEFCTGRKLARFFPHNSRRKKITLTAAKCPAELPNYFPLCPLPA